MSGTQKPRTVRLATIKPRTVRVPTVKPPPVRVLTVKPPPVRVLTVKPPPVRVPTRRLPTVKFSVQKHPTVPPNSSAPINLRLPSHFGPQPPRFSGLLDPNLRGGQLDYNAGNGWGAHVGHHTPSGPFELPMVPRNMVGFDIPFPRKKRH